VARVENNTKQMQVYTDQPGLQFYTGNFLGQGPNFKGGIPQIPQGAFCLEAQTEPNCINHGEGIYKKGETYKQLTVYEFIAK
jgi:aldose 1-epimerase